MRWTALLIVAALAGCADTTPQVEDELAGLNAHTTDTTGAITGVVVTETLAPIVGANVTISSGFTMVTQEDGIFRFEGLEPGPYFVTANAPDHLQAQSSAIVSAGEVSKVRVILALDPAPKPYNLTLEFAGFSEAWIGIAGWAYDLFLADVTGIYACDPCRFNFSADPTLETLVLEATWDETIDPGAASPLLTGYYMTLYDADGLYDSWYIDDGEAIHVSAESLAGPDFEVSVYPDDVWPGIQQGYDLYVTQFHITPAPDGWSFIAGDE